MLLEQGRRYRATVQLGMFQSLATNEMVQEKLVDLGFFDVVVTGSGSSRTAEGVWAGTSREVELPNQVKDVVAL